MHTTRLKQALKPLLPPILLDLARRIQHGTTGLSGDYATWAAALAASTGYDSEVILEQTRRALLKVKQGEAAYERDAVLFDEIEYAWPVLAALLWVAAQNHGTLNVLDLGGSLGSSFFQNRRFLAALPAIRWNIVEQPRHVQAGQTWFADEQLHFYPDLAACLAVTQPNVVLLSSVLQYLEHPYAMLSQLATLPCDQMIIDRTPFWHGLRDRLCVQHVPPQIYSASYPSWVFSQQRLYAHLAQHWQVIVRFDNPDNLPAPVRVIYQGAILVRQTSLS